MSQIVLPSCHNVVKHQFHKLHLSHLRKLETKRFLAINNTCTRSKNSNRCRSSPAMNQIRNVMKIIYWTLWYQCYIIWFWWKFSISKISMNQEISVGNFVPSYKSTETIGWRTKLFWYNTFDFSNMLVCIFNIPNESKYLESFL